MTDEELVPQVVDDDAATLVEALDERILRACTFSDWPPEPPPPVDEVNDAVAEGTTPPPARRARIYTAVRRPTTSSEFT